MTKELGFNETKACNFDDHDELVFKKGKKYITADKYGHNGAFWKLIDKNGRRYGTYDKYLKNKICG